MLALLEQLFHTYAPTAAYWLLVMPLVHFLFISSATFILHKRTSVRLNERGNRPTLATKCQHTSCETRVRRAAILSSLLLRIHTYKSRMWSGRLVQTFAHQHANIPVGRTLVKLISGNSFSNRWDKCRFLHTSPNIPILVTAAWAGVSCKSSNRPGCDDAIFFLCCGHWQLQLPSQLN